MAERKNLAEDSTAENITRDSMCFWSICVVSVIAAVIVFSHFWRNADQLWWSLGHDRNANYCVVQKMRTALMSGDVVECVRHLDRGSRVWGVLLPAATFPFVLVTNDFRWAVMPSLLGFIGAAIFAFLLARRLCRGAGNVAGMAAAVLVLVSPAFHGFAVDVMYESLGAFFTLMALYWYVRLRADYAVFSALWLGVSLTLLFLHKYNYWLLVVAALILTEMIDHRREIWGICRRLFSHVNGPWFLRQMRKPLNIIVLILFTATLFVASGSRESIKIGGMRISTQNFHNLAWLTYIALFIRVLLWWYKTGSLASREWDARLRTVICWHVWPLAVWFLLPKRLGVFLWYISPAQHGERPAHTAGFRFYWECFLQHYHVAIWSAIAVAALAAAAILCRAISTRGKCIVALLAVSILLTAKHPNQKSRFLHSWIPAAWILAGIGIGGIVGNRRVASRLRPGLAVTAVAFWSSLHVGELNQNHFVRAGGPNLAQPNALRLAKVWLPEIENSRQAVILCDVPSKFFTHWTYLQKFQRYERLQTHIFGFEQHTPENRAAFDRWIQSTHCDTLVFVHVPNESPYYEGQRNGFVPFRIWLKEQRRFRCISRAHGPDLMRAEITIWRRP